MDDQIVVLLVLFVVCLIDLYLYLQILKNFPYLPIESPSESRETQKKKSNTDSRKFRGLFAIQLLFSISTFLTNFIFPDFTVFIIPMVNILFSIMMYVGFRARGSYSSEKRPTVMIIILRIYIVIQIIRELMQTLLFNPFYAQFPFAPGFYFSWYMIEGIVKLIVILLLLGMVIFNAKDVENLINIDDKIKKTRKNLGTCIILLVLLREVLSQTLYQSLYPLPLIFQLEFTYSTFLFPLLRGLVVQLLIHQQTQHRPTKTIRPMTDA